jgi:hypothetical protein
MTARFSVEFDKTHAVTLAKLNIIQVVMDAHVRKGRKGLLVERALDTGTGSN